MGSAPIAARSSAMVAESVGCTLGASDLARSRSSHSFAGRTSSFFDELRRVGWLSFTSASRLACEMSGRELVPPTIPIPSDAAEGIPSDAIAPPAPKSADPRLPPAAVPPLPTLAPLTVRAGPAGPLAAGPLMSFQIWSIVFPLPLEVFSATA